MEKQLTYLLRTKLGTLAALGALLITGRAYAVTHFGVSAPKAYAVMSQPINIPFQITNQANSSGTIGAAQITMPTGYQVLGGVAPPGWIVQQVDSVGGSVQFVTQSPCSTNGLAPNTSAIFTVTAIGSSSSSDVSETNRNVTTQECNGVSAQLQGSFPHWTRKSFSSSLSVSPQTAGSGSQVTLSLALTNFSTQSQSGIVPSSVATSGSASASLVSGPSPSSMTLAANASGTFTWTYQVSGSGSVTFTVSAHNGNSTASSPSNSATVVVSPLAATMTVSPSQALSGQNVSVLMTVSNNTSGPVTSVTPNSVTTGGTASASFVSGPTPASVANLPPGGSAVFTWQYTVTGTVGQTYNFASSASGTSSSGTLTSNTATSGNGAVVLYAMTVSPISVSSGATNATLSFTVSNGGSSGIQTVSISDPGSPAICGTPSYSGEPSGWTGSGTGPYTFQSGSSASDIAPGASATFLLNCATMASVSTNTAYVWPGNLTDRANAAWAASASPFNIIIAVTPSDPGLPAAVAGNTVITHNWNNPSTHDGTVVLRASGAAPNTAPTNGVQYTAGQTIGNATVAYADLPGSYVSSFVDSGLTNGTSYTYAFYNRDQYFTYSPGSNPSTGLQSTPTSQSYPSAAWAYSLGSPSLSGPMVLPNTAIFSASNAGISANQTAVSSHSLDGQELYRPISLSVAGRFGAGPRSDGSGNNFFVGDTSGFAYGVDASTGTILWTTAQLGDRIQAAITAQLWAYTAANSAFRTTYPTNTDVLFVPTRNSSTTTNQVYALNAATGATLWTYTPGNLDIISGTPFVDYTNNQLWVASRAGSGGTQASLRIISTLNGSEIATLTIGDIDQSVTSDFTYAYVVNNSGTIYAYNLATHAQAWSYSLGAGIVPNSFVFPISGSFYLTTTDGGGHLRRLQNNGASAPTPVWNVAVSGASGLVSTSQKIYVGSNVGLLYQVNEATGALEANRNLYPNGGALTVVGTPSSDYQTQRVHAGTADGRIFSFSTPF